MIFPNTAPWRLNLKVGDKLEFLPIIAWWIDETDAEAVPKPITPLGVHHDPNAYRLVSGFGTMAVTPGAAPKA